MSERWLPRVRADQWADAQDELQERHRRDVDELATVSGKDLSAPADLDALNALLHGLFPRGASPWIELWCDGHPTGAAVRAMAKGGPGFRVPDEDGRRQADWMIEPMARAGVPQVTAVAVWDVDLGSRDEHGMPDYRPADTPAPERWQVDCGRCGAVRRFLPGRLDELIPRALTVWAQRRDAGSHGRPRVVLPGATA